MKLTGLLTRTPRPAPWAEGEKIPWNEPGFSARMLAEHLSQEHDAASRRFAVIDRHVDWIHASVLAGRTARVLDLGCGPGLYTSRLARRGHDCTGIDFSPASIAYARDAAAREGLACRYSEGDLRSVDYGSGYGLAMFVFGEFNVFQTADARRILRKAHAALVAGGLLLLEPHRFAAVQRIGQSPPAWYSSPGGLFCARPHLCLTENFWDEAACAATERYYIVDAETGEVTSYASSMQAYRSAGYRSLLETCGFQEIRFHASLEGKENEHSGDLMAVVARK
ncbi:MAG: class I SAM-dependent methyltransferase [Anaerolineales bacterium]|nr:class I SAM-dependent methyltransferase [Anaerolineales bacterium]